MGGGRGVWYQSLVLTPSWGHCSGQYASYWNTFLFYSTIVPTNYPKLLVPTLIFFTLFTRSDICDFFIVDRLAKENPKFMMLILKMFYYYRNLLKISLNTHTKRMHSSRMRTARSSSRWGVSTRHPPEKTPPWEQTTPWEQTPQGADIPL